MPRVAFSIALRASRDGFPRQQALDIQERISDHAPTPEGKAEALFWRCYLIAGTDSQPEERARAVRDLATVIELGDASSKQQGESLRFELTRLQIGMQAPDIEGEDLDGVAFKLSDYEGKVVLLDFWGDW